MKKKQLSAASATAGALEEQAQVWRENYRQHPQFPYRHYDLDLACVSSP